MTLNRDIVYNFLGKHASAQFLLDAFSYLCGSMHMLIYTTRF